MLKEKNKRTEEGGQMTVLIGEITTEDTGGLNKKVMIVFGETEVGGYECEWYETDTCDACKAKYDCYTHQFLKIPADKLGLEAGKRSLVSLDTLVNDWMMIARGEKTEYEDVVIIAEKVVVSDADFADDRADGDEI